MKVCPNFSRVFRNTDLYLLFFPRESHAANIVNCCNVATFVETIGLMMLRPFVVTRVATTSGLQEIKQHDGQNLQDKKQINEDQNSGNVGRERCLRLEFHRCHS